MADIVYIKLKDVVGDSIAVEKVFPYKYKAWDNDAKKFVESDTPQKGFQKKYATDTDKGRVEFSQAQMAAMLEEVCDDGRSDINGQTFKVTSNGKEGMEIRYWFNAVKDIDIEGDMPEDWLQ